VERRHMDDYVHGDRNRTGKAGLLRALLNSRRKQGSRLCRIRVRSYALMILP
jgi:hypothetical protein